MQGRSSNRETHVVPNLCLSASRLPNANLVQAAYPQLVDVGSTAELKVAKGNKAGEGAGGNGALLSAVDIE